MRRLGRTGGDSSRPWRDGICAGRMVARRAQPGHHRSRHTELLQSHQLPGRMAQDTARPTQALSQVVSQTKGWPLKYINVMFTSLLKPLLDSISLLPVN